MSERSSHSGEEKSYFPAKIIRSISICFLCQKGGEPASSVYMITPELHLQQENIKLSDHLKCRAAIFNCTGTIVQSQLFLFMFDTKVQIMGKKRLLEVIQHQVTQLTDRLFIP